MVNLNQFKQKATTVRSLVEDIRKQMPDREDAETLDNNYYELYNMISEISETLDIILSDVEK